MTGQGRSTADGSDGWRGPAVALVPAKDAAETIAATVGALRELVDEVLVVDDGSTDTTAETALAAGASVLRLGRNRGKGAAVTAGVEATPEAAVYLLVDADTGASAAGAARLLAAVAPQRAGEAVWHAAVPAGQAHGAHGEGHGGSAPAAGGGNQAGGASGGADMAVGVLPGVGTAGGFGVVRRVAAAGIRRGCGFAPRAPLSGQRAVRGPLLRRLLPLAPRFGLETALTMDARRAGAAVVEVDVDMSHRPTGRGPAGFAHRGRQGADIVRALWPRLTTARQRVGAVVLVAAVVAGAMLWSGSRWEPSSVAPGRTWSKVVLFDMPGLEWSDVGVGHLPNYDRLAARGALAATSVRTLEDRPSVAEGWATVNAGTRVAAGDEAGFAFGADDPLEGGTAAAALARRSGGAPRGSVVVVGAPATIRTNAHRHLSSAPGALGAALHAAGLRTAAVGNADTGLVPRGVPTLSRPVAAAVMDGDGSVDAGAVGTDLLAADGKAAFGRRADPGALLAAFDRARASADVVVVGPGDLERSMAFSAVAGAREADAARARALASTDDLLGEVSRRLGPDTLLLVASVAPPTATWHLEPLVAVGAGVPPGYLHSPSVRRLGIVALTDVTPTVLAALGRPVPGGMIGHPLRFHPGPVHLSRLAGVDRDANFREGYWFPLTMGYIVFQGIVYLLAGVALGRPGGTAPGRWAVALRWTVLAIAALPLASFLFRALPGVAELGGPGLVLMGGIDAAIVALSLRARRHALSPLAWILGATVVLFGIDVATGARLQASSLLGYSLHTAARFTGIGNSAFAALAAATLLGAAVHLHWAPRRREAVVGVACLFALAVLLDGAPSLGDDFGGILTLVPVMAVSVLVLTGRRLRPRTVAAAVAVGLVVVALAVGADLLRAPQARTHVGSSAASLAHPGSSPLPTTVARKIGTNLRTYKSPWAWIVVMIAIYGLVVLGWLRGWSRLLPPGSALRVGVVGALATGVLGNALNDSGVVVTALVFVYIGPFLTLLALDGREPAPVLLRPHGAPAARAQPMVVA